MMNNSKIKSEGFGSEGIMIQKPDITFDRLSRPTKVIYSDKRTVSFQYDDVGNITKVRDSVSGTTAYRYDLMDRLTKIIYPNGHTLSYLYDAVGNRKRVTYPNGETIYHNYNPNNWLTEVINGANKTLFEYDKVGNLIKKILPNGVTVTYAYNSIGRLLSLVATDTKGSTILHLSCKLDAHGNCLEIVKHTGTSNNGTCFVYDSLYHLIKVKYSEGGEVEYKYDDIGNRLSVRASSVSTNSKLLKYLVKPMNSLGILRHKTSYAYNFKNQLITAGDIEFKYDENGNLNEKTINNEITRYTSDCNNRLIRIDYPDDSYSGYTYDFLGRRISKRNRNSQTIHYLYDGYNLIGELDDARRLIASYIYGFGIDHPISMNRGGKTYYYLYDLLGSVIALTDEEGKIVAEYEYDVWGNIIKETREIENPFRFTGREWDDDSRLYYYRARYYDPSVGRFISKDPFPGFGANPESLNRYVYVNSNPQTYRDPFGLLPWEWGPQNWLWQSMHQGGEIQYAKQFWADEVQYAHQFWAAQAANSLANSTPSNWLLQASKATAYDIIGGFPVGQPVTRAQAFGQGMWGVVPGFSPVGSIAAINYNLIQGDLYGAAVGVGTSMVGGKAASLWGESIGGLVNLSFTSAHIATTIPSIPASDSTTVGGVLLDQAADVLTDLEEITGAYWDDKVGQLVLVGKKNSKMEERYLPRMDKDHLSVAMRAVFSGDNLGVSIDPPPSYLESGKFPPDGTKMFVRYLGNTKDTLFGAIMFDADKLLKNLSMGVDNETRKEVTSQVLDFQNELDLSLKYGTEKPNAWHRMWFVIEDMRLDMIVNETPDRNALCFGKASLKVKTEYISKEEKLGSNPAAEHFAKHFTLHFDDFAREYPILERLRELAKIVAIAKWLKNSGKPIDLSFLDGYKFMSVPTPSETQGITVSKSKSWQSMNAIHTQTYSLYGGVDFDFQYRPIKDDGWVLALKKITRKNKPCETCLTWDFKSKGETQRALAFPMTKINDSYVTTHTDFSLSSTGGIKLELARCYDSFNPKPSIFGYGWSLKIPYKLFVLNPQKSNSPLLLLDKITGKSYKYIFIEDKGAYYLVSEEKEEEGRILFSYDPHKVIRKNHGDGFVWESDNIFIYYFDSQGRLISEVSKNNKKLDYTYQRERVITISDSSGRSMRLFYDHKNRVKEVIASGEVIINYLYNCYDDLIKVSDNKGNVKSYIYDVDHHLIKAKDTECRIFRNSYDPLGRVIKKRQDVIADRQGNLITRSYDDDFQLVKEEDKGGNTILYDYDKDGNLTKTIISDRLERKYIFEHDEEERIRKIINPLGHCIRFTCDTSGNVTSVINPNGNIRYFKYDNDGNPVLIQDAMGNQWKQEFDDLSRLRAITNPTGNKIKFDYDGDRLSIITIPEGSISM